MTYLEAYILTRLDPFKSLFSSLSIYLGVLLLIFCIVYAISWLVIAIESEGETITQEFFESVNRINKIIKKTILFFIVPIFCVVSLVKNLIPTTKEMAFIYIAPAIVNNKDVQKTIQKIPELSGLGLEYLTETLKGEINEVKGEVKEVVKDTAKEIKTKTKKEIN